jgi:hypothetical protein
VEALTPLLGPANKELQKQAVRTIKNLSKSTSPSPSFSVCVCVCVCVCVDVDCVCSHGAHASCAHAEYKKRLAAKESLLNSLQSVASESSSANVQKVAKKTLSRLQLSTK